MNRNLKVALIILAAVLILCLCLCGAGLIAFRLLGQSMGNMVSTNPTQAAQVAGQIAEFETPPGFEEGSMDFFGFQVVFLHGSGSQANSMITMMQFPQSLAISEEQMRQQMETFANQQAEAQVKGETVTFTVLERQSDSGVDFRQWAGVFPGRGGPTFLTITAPVDEWDQNLIDNFLGSIQ